jgi:uncharacterized protein
MHTKAIPQYTKKIAGRTVTGVFSVFGNRDSYDDIIQPGAFLDTIARRGAKVVHLWSHSFDQPPIAKVISLREIGRADLPAAARAAYPEATGGAEVTREYFETPRGDEVLATLKAGAPLEMSFGFDPLAYHFGDVGGVRVRFLSKVELYETSDVLFGANSATAASKARTLPSDPLLRQARYELDAMEQLLERASKAPTMAILRRQMRELTDY